MATRNSTALEAAKIMRTTRHSVGGAAMGGPPPKSDPMDSEQNRRAIAMENWKQERENKDD